MASLSREVEKAISHQKAGRLQSAWKIFAKLIRRFPGDISVLHNGGICAFQSGDLKRALKWVERAKAKAPDEPDIHYTLACIH